MAGVSRLQYTTEIRLIRVMCSGRVDLEFVLKAFLNGQDGVFIGGCRLGECNYLTHGNYHALNMVLLCKRIMEYIGINSERLQIEFMSSGDGILLAEKINHFTGKIKRLGPVALNNQTKLRLEEIIRLVPYLKIKFRNKLDKHLENTKKYHSLFSKKEIALLFHEIPAFYIDSDKCKACMICKSRCPADAIDGAKKKIHIIDQDKCIKCATCLKACPPKFNAIKVETKNINFHIRN